MSFLVAVESIVCREGITRSSVFTTYQPDLRAKLRAKLRDDVGCAVQLITALTLLSKWTAHATTLCA